MSIAAIALLVGCAAPTVHPPPDSKQPRLLLDGLVTSGSLPGFYLAQSSQGRASTLLTLTNAQFTVKIEVFADVAPETADVLTEEGVMSLRALYADALSPYPGDISNRIVSDQKFQPDYREKKQDGTRYRYFLLHANERMGYGATTADSARFRSLIGWIYCQPGRNLFKVRCFAPLVTPGDSIESWFLSLRCP